MSAHLLSTWTEILVCFKQGSPVGIAWDGSGKMYKNICPCTYKTIIVALDKGRPITTWKGRRIEDVLAWFTSRPQDDLDGVAMVGLDMSKSFYSSLREVCGDHVQVIER